MALTGLSGGGSGGGSGTTTSVGLVLPNDFTVTGSPVTTAGTLTATRAVQGANTIMAGPTTGANDIPTYRSLVLADIPAGVALTGSSNTFTALQTINVASGNILAGQLAGVAKFAFDSTGTLVSGGVNADLIVSQGGTKFIPASALSAIPVSALTDGGAANGQAPISNGAGVIAWTGPASASVFGAVKVDGTTITASGGILSSAGGATSPLTLTSTAAGQIPLTLASYSGVQTGDLLDIKDNLGNVLVSVDKTGNINLPAVAAPTAPTVALAGAGAGSVTNGTHVVTVTFVTTNGQTIAGANSSAVNVTDNTTNGKIAVSAIPLGPGSTTARKVYMSKAGTTTPLFLVTTINENTSTTATLNTADGSLGANPPAFTTAVPNIVVGGNIALGSSPSFGSGTTGVPYFPNGLHSNNGLFLAGGALSMAGQSITSCGGLTLNDAANIVVNTTTGTKIGTVGGAAGQKLGFFAAAPVVQPLLATGGGATADNIITVLQTLGLCRQS